MSEHREATRQHYDLHAQQQQHLPTSLALKARREGPAAPLKKFHNDIKRRLIYRFAYQVEALIDYACGRGGDLHKWKAAMVRYVKGLDISGAEIAEAERRLGELLATDCQLQVEFQQTDRLGQEPHEELRQFDVATCMFAIHYFFDKAETLRTLLASIASNLKPGGYFIGCVPDGKRVKAHLQKNKGKLVEPHLVLKTVTGDFNSFGSSYIMEIPDTVVEGHEGVTEGSHEYLVFDKVLLAEAAKAGLYPVKDLGDEELDQLFEPGDKDKAMKHFKPQYPATTHDSLKTASQLYMAFVLQKAASAADVSVPALPPRETAGGGGRGGGDRSAAGRGGARPQQRGGNKMSSLEWTLPYPAVSLPQKDLPSVFVNVRHDGLQKRAHALRRWIIYPPPLPEWSGPVQYVPDMNGNPTQPIPQHLPNGAAVWEYLTELNYHRDIQAQQAGYPMPPQQQPPHHQQQHQGPGGRPANGQQQRHGQPSGMNDPQHPGSGPPDTSRGPGGGRGSRGRGRGSKAAAAAASAASAASAAGDGAQDAAGAGRGGGRGRGRGSRGGRAAGSKRERPPDGVEGGTGHDAAQAGLDSDSHAAAAADGEAADAAETPRAAKQPKLEAAAAADGGSGGGAAAASTPAAGEAAAGSAADGAAAAAAAAGPPALSAAEKAAARLAKVIAADPMGYKEREVPPELPADVLQKALEHAPQYEDPQPYDDHDQQPYDDQQQFGDQQHYGDQQAGDDQQQFEDQQQHEGQQQHEDQHQYEEEEF